MMEKNISYEQLETLAEISTINEKKDWLQNLGLQQWLSNKKSYFEWCTGTGKTMMLCKIAKYCEERIPGFITFVIVPTAVLKEQFEETLKKLGVKNSTVYVINTYVNLISKGVKMHCNLLIGDEIHTMAGINSMFFSTAIPETKFDVFAGGSATLEKQHVAYLKKLGVTCCSEFSLEDSQVTGLSPSYTIYNVPVELTEEEKEQYAKADREYWSNFQYFDSMMPFLTENVWSRNTYSFISAILQGKKYVKWDGQMYTGNSLAELFAHKKNELQGLNLNKGHIFNRALLYRSAVSERRDILNSAKNLTETTIQILNSINERSLVFCERTSSCNEIASRTNSVEYHSGIKSIKTKKQNLEKFLSSDDIHLISCKSLQAGFDDENIRIGIKHSYTSKGLNATQSVGRLLRITEKNKHFKTSILINLYVNDFMHEGELFISQQKKWLQNAFKDIPNVEWINNLSEIKI